MGRGDTVAQILSFNQTSSIKGPIIRWTCEVPHDWISTDMIGYLNHWYHYHGYVDITDITNITDITDIWISPWYSEFISELYNDWIFYDNSVFHMTITLRLVESPRIAAAIWVISPSWLRKKIIGDRVWLSIFLNRNISIESDISIFLYLPMAPMVANFSFWRRSRAHMRVQLVPSGCLALAGWGWRKLLNNR
jgi:hypothetical protein